MVGIYLPQFYGLVWTNFSLASILYMNWFVLTSLHPSIDHFYFYSLDSQTSLGIYLPHYAEPFFWSLGPRLAFVSCGTSASGLSSRCFVSRRHCRSIHVLQAKLPLLSIISRRRLVTTLNRREPRGILSFGERPGMKEVQRKFLQVCVFFSE